MYKISALLALLLIMSVVGYSHTTQDTAKDKQTDMGSIFDHVNKRMDHLNGNDSLMKSLAVLSKEDSALKKALSDYNLFGLAHRKRALQWNLTSSIIIFWSVIFLVFSGICFAGVQFYISMRMAGKAGVVKVEGLDTSLEAGTQGVKVSSPVLGVIILVISMLFFYLYLQFVYPVMEIF